MLQSLTGYGLKAGSSSFRGKSTLVATEIITDSSKILSEKNTQNMS